MGRPSSYNEDIDERICTMIAGGTTLRAICRLDDMPAWQTVYRWLEANEGFRDRFARARLTGFDAIAQEALDIADTTQAGVRRKVNADGVEETIEDMLGHRKLQIETRLKLLAKWDPKRYGDRLELAGDAASPLVVQTVQYTPPPKDEK